MAALGSDLWAPACVAVLKKMVAKEAKDIIQEYVTLNKGSTTTEDERDDTDTAADGDSHTAEIPQPSSSSPELQTRRLKQLVFDALYIQRFVATPDDGKDELVDWMQRPDVADVVDAAAVTRLKKNASDYVKKTYLLFALLA
jgi:hypothetical protein